MPCQDIKIFRRYSLHFWTFLHYFVLQYFHSTTKMSINIIKSSNCPCTTPFPALSCRFLLWTLNTWKSLLDPLLKPENKHSTISVIQSCKEDICTNYYIYIYTLGLFHSRLYLGKVECLLSHGKNSEIYHHSRKLSALRPSTHRKKICSNSFQIIFTAIAFNRNLTLTLPSRITSKQAISIRWAYCPSPM